MSPRKNEIEPSDTVGEVLSAFNIQVSLPHSSFTAALGGRSSIYKPLRCSMIQAAAKRICPFHSLAVATEAGSSPMG